jgi:hypothetical protein
MAGTDKYVARGGVAVTPGTPFPKARALWVGTAGDVNVRFADGGTAIYNSVVGRLDVECIEVLSASTTASNITTMV